VAGLKNEIKVEFLAFFWYKRQFLYIWQLGVRQPDKEEEAGESSINSMNIFDLKLKVR